MPARSSDDLGRTLEPGLRARLDAGEHEAVAVELAAAERQAEAGWVLEQIWDFAGATRHYLAVGRLVDAVRTSVEARDPQLWAAVFDALRRHRDDRQLLDTVSALLRSRGRHDDAAAVLELAAASPEQRAAALVRAGSPLAAAEVFAEAGLPRRALEALGAVEIRPTHLDTGPSAGDRRLPSHPREHALAAELCWDLGDAEGAARHAQQARRAGALEGELGRQVRSLLARALACLGHDLAGQLVLAEADQDEPERSPSELEPQGRYRVTATLPAPFAGAAYVGVDRVSLQEVELHLLISELQDQAPDPGVRGALERFTSQALRADALGHPAIRPIIRAVPEIGLLVMPRREGPVLRSLIRAPGMAQATARARALVVFILDALAAAHGVGLVHGSLLPSQIVCDALGRPLLGPFGAHHLAGLVATRTGGLEELLSLTPPEQRRGAAPSEAGDIYMLGALWAALLAGYFSPPLDELPAGERDDIARMLAEDPSARPSAREALTRLRTPVDDLTTLAHQTAPQAEESMSQAARIDPRLGVALDVVAADSWSEAELDLLCMARNPWLQNILDREGRAFRLAAWPAGCRTLDDGAPWREHLPALALGLLSAAGEPNAPEDRDPDETHATLREAVVSRMSGACVVVTPAGELMLALDQLLARSPT